MGYRVAGGIGLGWGSILSEAWLRWDFYGSAYPNPNRNNRTTMLLLTMLLKLPIGFAGVLGHAGHGPVVDGGDGATSLLHALTSPEHLIPAAVASACLGVVVWMVREIYRISKPT